jgi:SAM-dependent methyltransferase
MLDHAAARQPADERITWRQADTLALPFDDGAFDVVLCQFGAMFFPDRPAGYGEARRVLRTGGSFIFNVWDRIEANGFSDLVTRTAAEVFPHDPPQFLARTPHGYHDTEQVRQDLAKAGYSDISITTLQEVSRAATARDAAIAYCMGTPLRSEIEVRDSAKLDLVTDLATQAIANKFGDGTANGSVEGKISGHIITANR